MISNSSYILIPILTEETMKKFASEMKGYNLICTPFLRILSNYKVIEESLGNAVKLPKDKILSVFTSKNGVKVFFSYLLKKNILSNYSYLFKHVACIGPSTMEYLLKRVSDELNGFRPLSLFVPDEHTSSGLSRLLMNLDLIPILWASSYVDIVLRDIVSSLGGSVANIYEVSLERDRLKEFLHMVRNMYKEFFFVFMSVRALESVGLIERILKHGVYGVFISKRVYKAADKSIFRKCFVYDGHDINGFYEFIRGVIPR